MHLQSLFTLALFLHPSSARLLHSLPEDTYAFPKFRVAFLNGLPLLNETAERWLKEGLRGGELEFLDQPYLDDASSTPGHWKEIGSGDSTLPTETSPMATVNYTLEHMKMGPRDSYLCLIPHPLDNIPSLEEDDLDIGVTPARSWSLLQPLSGTCLYHRQGWFTYSYCHNQEIRQFKELIPPHSRIPAGAYKPEEDPEWESYTLGRSPQSTENGADLSIAEQNAEAANLELARTAGSRYLVQRWGDGTTCDKTGKSREVEVQFHCSMVMTDHILFVKEAKTCSYVLVIHTPRLCGEPGFKSSRDAGEEAQIRCREVVDTKPEGPVDLPTADHPLKVPRRKTVLPAAPPKEKGSSSADQSRTKEDVYNDLLQKTLEAFMASKGTGAHSREKGASEDDFIIELLDDPEDLQVEGADRLVEALRAAGYDVQAEVVTAKGTRPPKGKGKDQKKQQQEFDPHRDEL